jgi:hypothetical protein
MGAFLALKDRGLEGDTLMIEKGKSTTYYSDLIEKAGAIKHGFPSIAVQGYYPVTLQEPFNSAISENLPWTHVVGSVDTFNIFADSNTVGGQSAYNSLAWSADNLSIKTLPEVVRPYVSTVTSALDLPNAYTCKNECLIIKRYVEGLQNPNITFFYSGTTYKPRPPTFISRLNFEDIYVGTDSALNLLTGTHVDRIERSGVMIDPQRYVLKDRSSQTIASCNTVILAGGAIHTPALLKRSPDILDLVTDPTTIGKGLADHYGVVVTGTFLDVPVSIQPNYFANGAPMIEGPGGLSQSLHSCFPRYESPVLICVIIIYGADLPPRVGEVTDGSGSFTWKLTLDQAYQDSYLTNFDASIDALENFVGVAGSYNISTDFTGSHVLKSKDQVKQSLRQVINTAGMGNYHHMASMLDAVVDWKTGNYQLKNVPNMYVADGSAMRGYTGSTMAPIAAIGYKSASDAINGA